MVQTAAGCCWERGLDHKQLKAQLLETQAAVGLRLKANSEKLEELQSSMEVNYRRRATRLELHGRLPEEADKAGRTNLWTPPARWDKPQLTSLKGGISAALHRPDLDARLARVLSQAWSHVAPPASAPPKLREEKDASACGACPKEHSVDRILDELHALVVQLSPQLANSSVEGAARINANNGSSLTPRQLFGKPSARSQHGRDRLPPDSANSLATPHDVELRSWTSGRSQHCRRRSLTGAELSEKEQPEWAHKRVSLGTVSSIPYECSTDSGSHEALDDQSFTFDSQSDAS
mmetsp:Transcript_7093/g.18497  ORF Transcript_7093/g.18497 Transcript_7093/m.18497 type:complete len:292 (-) Transcript_7093:90-965(-)